MNYPAGTAIRFSGTTFWLSPILCLRIPAGQGPTCLWMHMRMPRNIRQSRTRHPVHQACCPAGKEFKGNEGEEKPSFWIQTINKNEKDKRNKYWIQNEKTVSSPHFLLCLDHQVQKYKIRMVKAYEFLSKATAKATAKKLPPYDLLGATALSCYRKYATAEIPLQRDAFRLVTNLSIRKIESTICRRRRLLRFIFMDRLWLPLHYWTINTKKKLKNSPVMIEWQPACGIFLLYHALDAKVMATASVDLAVQTIR